MTPADSTTRPRVEGEREQEILDAALEVLAEVGYDRLTMDAVATRAKASKATLYRRWTNKLTLVIDALVAQKATPEPPDTGSLRGDLAAAYCGFGGLTDPRDRRPLHQRPHRDRRATPSSPRPTAPRCSAPRSPRACAIFERARARGELRDDLDISPDRPGAAGHRPPPLLHARRGPQPRTSSIASSTRSSCPPAALQRLGTPRTRRNLVTNTDRTTPAARGVDLRVSSTSRGPSS